MEQQKQPTQLDRERQRLLTKRSKLLRVFSDAAERGKGRQLEKVYTQIRESNAFLEILRAISAGELAAAPTGLQRYVVSSLFLRTCFDKLTADQNEPFFFITGAEIAGAFIMDQMAEFTHQERTPVGVVADLPSTHRLLIRLEQFGHKFIGHFLSHPGIGPRATNPSGTAGHLAVMAIFSRDGFIRFIRLDGNFEIKIYGEGVEQHGPGIYRLTNLN